MSLYKKILENLKEIAKKYLYVSNGEDKEENIRQFNFHVGELYKNIIEIDGLELVKDTEDKLKENFVRFYYTVNTQLYDPPTEEVLAKENNLTKEEEIQKRKYAYGHWENGKCKHTPCIIYRLKDGCKYRPEHDDCTSGINLRLQQTVSLEPNEFKKIDLGIKMFSNRCRPIQLTPKLDTCLKYSVHLMTGLVDVWFNHYTQIGIHNLSNEKVTIPEGKMKYAL
jgi:dUTPase